MGTPTPGQIGPYRIERLLGAGGMGAVYLGRHSDTGAAAAIKLIRPEHAADPSFRARLRREVTAAQQVPRFCTAPVLDADVDADPPWVATEYIDAPTLDVALVGAPPLAGANLETFAITVAVALRAIHQHGVIHRDLKPSNVLMSPQGPRVIDFGIARPADPDRLLTRLTHTGHGIGTPAYMAPEQFTGGPLTPAVDVYAWARLVGYAATGGLNPPAPGGLPEPLRTLITAALDPDPAARPTAAQLVDRLTAHRPAPTLVAVTVPDVSVPAGRPRSRRLLATLAAGLVLVAATIAAVQLWPDGSTPGPGPEIAGTAGTGPPGDPGTEFGSQIHSLAGHPGAALAIALGTVADTPIAVTGSDRTVRIWDLTSGQAIGDPLIGHTGEVWGVALGELAGTPVAVTAGDLRDRSVRVWDLATGELLGEPLTGHTGHIWDVAVATLGTTPVAVTSSEDRTVRVWDLATGEPLGEPLTGHAGAVFAVATGERDGIPIAVTGSRDQTVRLWDLTTGESLGEPLSGHTGPVRAVALATLGTTQVVVTGGEDRTVRIWDLATGEPLGEPLTGHTGPVFAVATGNLDGTPVAVTGSRDQTVRLWDLTTGESLGEPLSGHTGAVYAVALGELDGYPIVASGSADRTARIWSLAPPGS